MKAGEACPELMFTHFEWHPAGLAGLHEESNFASWLQDKYQVI